LRTCLEGWQLARSSPVAILRDASLRDAPQDEVERWYRCYSNFEITKRAHVPAKWDPVRQGEPLFADKDMRQHKNLRRFPVILDHWVIHGSLGDPI
jgi:hypothetical protein